MIITDSQTQNMYYFSKKISSHELLQQHFQNSRWE